MGESPCFMNLFPPDEHLPSQQHETMTPARAVVVIRHGERLEQHETMKPARAVVVIRHGERLDWNMRDRGENWIPTADRPWDPPLTDQGREQANALGLALPKILETLNLPSIAAVYSSPFYRCRQTASELCASDDKLKVKVEVGLTESINLFWFQSWAMSGSDGTWGYGKDDCPDAHLLDPETLHPLSKQPVQPLLDWKQGGADPILENKMDLDYVSKTSVDTPYSLHPPKFEDINIPGQRMHHTLNQLSEFHPNETIVLVTHGGPATRLYERLTTGNNCIVHGTSRYCCYTIYKQEECKSWKPFVVNRVVGEEGDSTKEVSSNKETTFTLA